MIIHADKLQPFLWSAGYENIRVFAYTHTLVQCSPASVGLAQARSNYLTVSQLSVLLFTVGGFSKAGR